MEKVSCAVGITLLLSSIIMSILNLKKDKFNNFVELLNPEQKKIYEEIIMNYYYLSCWYGFRVIAGYLYYVYNKKCKYLFCKVIAIMVLLKWVSIIYIQKKPLMINIFDRRKTSSSMG